MDCIEGMRLMPDNSVDSIVTDPPYGIRFMGKAWDGADLEKRYQTAAANESDRMRNGRAAAAGKYDLAPAAMRAFQEFSEEWAREALRVLKPGGHLLAFSSPRTYHRMACGIEDAGFELRDQIMWVFGSGFPKSLDVSKAIDKTGGNAGLTFEIGTARQWDGWGTALKPAHEPICVARKPLVGTVAANVLAHGTGALNIDACRVTADDGENRARPPRAPNAILGGGKGTNLTASEHNDAGRWPANLIHDGSDEAVALFPQSAGQLADASTSDTQSAARFFYCAKASTKDRGASNTHPTVKPTDLMRYLCRLVTPPGGIVLDPFTGSGSTGKAAKLEGFLFMGFELDPEYAAIANARIEAAHG
jgi:site-specific DNA-methyltransferase (adenine-specific)